MYTADIAESIFHFGLDFIFWGVLPDFLNLDRGHVPYYPMFNIVIYLLTLYLITYLINCKFFKGEGSVFSYFTIKFPDFIKILFLSHKSSSHFVDSISIIKNNFFYFALTIIPAPGWALIHINSFTLHHMFCEIVSFLPYNESIGPSFI